MNKMLMAISVALAVGLGSVVAPGQERVALPVVAPGGDKDAKDSVDSGGVYVPDSGEALQRIRQAQRLADGKEWDLAAQMYQDVYQRYGNRLLADEPSLFVSVAEYVNRLLGDWPAEGLKVYRKRYDSLAKMAYEQAAATGDASEMAALARQYWVTSIGPVAADEAAELAMEAGRFSSAIDLWGRLLAKPPRLPDGAFKIAPVMAKLIVAYTWNNQPAEAKVLRERLVKEFPDWPSTFAGGGDSLLKWTERYGESLLAHNVRSRQGEDYPILGGAVDRNGVGPGTLNFGPEMWHFNGHRDTTPAPANPRVYPRPGVPTGRAANTISPVVSNNVLYIASPMGMFALSAANGTTPLWRNTDYRVATQNPNMMNSGATLYSPTYHEGRLYVDYGGPSQRSYWGGFGSGRPDSQSGLACLDAASGKLMWRLNLDELPNLRGGFLDASPLAFSGRVYAVVHVVRSVFDGVSLVSLDARTGRVIWQQPVSESESSTGYQAIRGFGSLPAAEGNTIYVCTNMGTIAAVSAETGLVRWLRQYDRNRTRSRGMFYNPTPPAVTNEYCPTMVWNGRVIASPADGNELLVLDAQTGKVQLALSKSKDLPDVKELYGVVDGKLIGRGSRVFAWDLVKNQLAWVMTLEAEPTYRGLLTERYLYLPSEKYLFRMDLARSGGTDRFPWAKPGQDGVVLMTRQQIITARPDRIAGFCEWENAERMVQATIGSLAPSSPARVDEILNYSQYAYATRRFALAQQQLTRSVEEVGGFAAINRPDLKNRMFIAALDIAREQWSADPKAARELLTMASQCAPDIEGHVRYRMLFAKYWEDYDDKPEAVRYYQDVLDDPTMRRAQYQIDDVTRSGGGDYARAQIDRLIEKEGPAVYAAVADRAGKQYDQASAKDNWAEIDRLIYQYPNASRTRSELYRLAAHLAGERKFEEAIGWLRYHRREHQTFLERHPAEEAKALATLANYALNLRDRWQATSQADERTRISQSRRALRQAYSYVSAGRRLSSEKVTIGGREDTFENLRAQFQKEYGKLLAVVPTVVSGLGAAREIPTAGGAQFRLLRPQIGQGAASNDDILLGLSVERNGMTGSLTAYRPGKSPNPIWTRKYDSAGQLILLTYYEEMAVVQAGAMVMALDPQTGEKMWAVEVRRDAVNPGVFGQPFIDVYENHLFVLNGGSVVVIDMEVGKVASRFQLADSPNSRPSVGERYLSFAGRTMQAHVVDWRTGKTVRRIDLPAQDMFWTAISSDGSAVVCGSISSGLTAYDVNSGRQLWAARMQVVAHDQNATPRVRGDAIIVAERAADEWRLSSRNMRTGRVMWERPLRVSGRNVAYAGMRMSLQDDELIVWSDTILAALDPDTGIVSYVPFLGQSTYVRDVLISQDYLVVSTSNNPYGGGRPGQQLEIRLYDRSGGGGVLEQRLRIADNGVAQVVVAPLNSGLAAQSLSGQMKLYAFDPPKKPASKP